MFCWKCKAEFELPITEKISFRATCEKCSAWLHVCKQCRHHVPGKPNECNVPGTDFIADREMANYCDDFSPKLQKEESTISSKEAIAKKLFGEERESEKPLNPSDPFSSLFKDEDEK
jgi:hypothetical protein